jgi:hypothetical protein
MDLNEPSVLWWPIAGKKYVITNSRVFPFLAQMRPKRGPLVLCSSPSICIVHCQSLNGACMPLSALAMELITRRPFRSGLEELLSRSLISCPSYYDQHSCPRVSCSWTVIQSMVTKYISIRSSHSKGHMSCESRIVNLGRSG